MSDKAKAETKEAETAAKAEDNAETPAAESETEASAEAESAAAAEAEGGEAEDDPPAEDAADPPKDQPDPTEELRAEIADLKDRLLRAAAEMENMRRRFEREMSDARQYAVTGFAREVLSIGDNLGRALGAVPENARKESEAMAALLEGVEMTERELLRVLDKHNVKRLEPHGEKFDPHFHQAMFEVEHDEAPHGTVVQVVQPGYSIGERVLRPAMVGVAKAKKKTEPKADAPANDEKSGEASEKNEAEGEKAANDG